ncbi:MAG TPA: hypothetical protein VFJ17_01920 [Mycobacteriales bacterium]|jgi:hypothetical protein|nr:hypothetical protein [Mycobacteriales bacterium]
MTPGQSIVRLSRLHPRLAACWFGVIGACLGWAIVGNDARVWAYLVVVSVLTAIVAMTDRVVGFSDTALLLLFATGCGHLAGGLLPGPNGGVLYDRWLITSVLRYDQVVHVVGSAAATVASWQLLGAWLDLSRTPARGQAVMAALAGLGKGAINEIFEFLASLMGSGTYVGGYTNTGWDLVFDLVGVTSAACVLVVSGAARRTEGPCEPSPRKALASRSTRAQATELMC